MNLESLKDYKINDLNNIVGGEIQKVIREMDGTHMSPTYNNSATGNGCSGKDRFDGECVEYWCEGKGWV